MFHQKNDHQIQLTIYHKTWASPCFYRTLGPAAYTCTRFRRFIAWQAVSPPVHPPSQREIPNGPSGRRCIDTSKSKSPSGLKSQSFNGIQSKMHPITCISATRVYIYMLILSHDNIIYCLINIYIYTYCFLLQIVWLCIYLHCLARTAPQYLDLLVLQLDGPGATFGG